MGSAVFKRHVQKLEDVAAHLKTLGNKLRDYWKGACYWYRRHGGARNWLAVQASRNNFHDSCFGHMSKPGWCDTKTEYNCEWSIVLSNSLDTIVDKLDERAGHTRYWAHRFWYDWGGHRNGYAGGVHWWA